MDPAVTAQIVEQNGNQPPATESPAGASVDNPITQEMMEKLLAVGKNAKVKAYLNILGKINKGEKVTMADVRTMEQIKKELLESSPGATTQENQQEGAGLGGIADGQTLPGLAPLKNLLALHEYVKAAGYKASKSVVYKHYNEGKIPQAKDGTFAIQEIERYAQTYLRRIDGSATASPEVADLQQKKAVVDLERAEIDRDSERLKLDKLKGSLVPSSLLEEELGRRAQLFRSDGETFWHATAPQIVVLVSGDPEKIPDLIEFGLTAEDDRLARYASATMAPPASDPVDELSLPTTSLANTGDDS